jgi:hypothetical protein
VQIPDELVERIVNEVLSELARRGVQVSTPAAPAQKGPVHHTEAGTIEIDMSAYRTPVLTESQLTRIGRSIGTIVVPCNTIVTPGASDILRSRKLTLVRKTQKQS